MTHDAYVIFGSGYNNLAILQQLRFVGLTVPILTSITK